MSTLSATGKSIRNFLPEGMNFNNWNELEPYYIDLVDRKIDSVEDLKAWLSDLSELESVVSEHAGWLYIKMTCDTTNKQLSDAYAFFVEQINPKIAPYTDKLHRKFVALPAISQLDGRYEIYVKQVQNSIRLFREENIPLEAQLSLKEQHYGEIAGAMTVEVEGKTLTLQQASNFLKKPDRKVRDEVYHKIVSRRQEDRTKLDELFNELIELRTTIAANAGFPNYRDYKFVALDRFDYTAKDCTDFHQSIRASVVPVMNELMSERKKQLGVDTLKPWDTDVDPEGKPDMKPFSKGTELLDKSIACFAEINPYFGHVLSTLKQRNYTDLDSRVGKAPGGYNYPLYESGVPFIFMNASGSLRDVITMVHEGGHAIHSMVTHDLEFIGFKNIPSEIAELASMSMELISMEHWHHFFPNPDDLKRAKREQLENVIEALPWIACVDAFQHWLYLNPKHTVEERTAEWKKLILGFTSSIIDWSTDQNALEAMWQKQLHLFEVPFYYIEYGMAQLGAIAVWRNYKQDPKKGVEQYLAALKLGYSRSIPEVYKEAGIRFDFSEQYIRELIEFVRSEMQKL
ncbi:MAG: M3 family oligoendopeptidase [Bacteroidia bacterium]